MHSIVKHLEFLQWLAFVSNIILQSLWIFRKKHQERTCDTSKKLDPLYLCTPLLVATQHLLGKSVARTVNAQQLYASNSAFAAITDEDPEKMEFCKGWIKCITG